MRVKVQKKGRITLPKKLREQAHIREGQWLQIDLQGETLLLRPEKGKSVGLQLREDHPIWDLVGKFSSGCESISQDKYPYLAQAYESKG